MDEESYTAYHEAGHAFAALYLGARVRRVSIDPDRDDGPNRYGETVVVWNPRRFTPQELATKSAIVALAGPVAEMVHREKPFHPAFIAEWRDDWRQALKSLEGIPHHGKRIAQLEKATCDLYESFRENSNWDAIAAIADGLLAHEILDEEMLRETVEPWMNF